jgi:hypothetical protein
MLAQIAKFSAAPVIWQKRLAYGMANFCGVNCVTSNDGKISYNSDELEAYLTQEFANYDISTRVKTDALIDANGVGLGLSQELIAQISGSAVFDKSQFESKVGRFSFPASLLFMLESVGGYQDKKGKDFKEFFKEITNGLFFVTAFPGWRVWQRTFAGTGDSTVFDVSYWKKLIPYQADK